MRALDEWSWLKASLPSSRGGVNLRSASLHAPSAFLASVSHSQGVVEKMLGHASILSLTPAPVLLLSLLLLPGLAGKLWRTSMCPYTSTPSLLPLMRPHTSDFFLQLLPPVPMPWPSPLLCPMLATGSMAFHWLLWVSISRIGSFDAVFSNGWEFLSTAPPTPVQNVTALQTSLETTKLDVEGMEIGSCDTMPSGTSSSLPPSLLLWPLPLNSPTSFLIPSPDQLISTSLPGAVVVLLHWMCMSYLLSSSRPWVRLPSPQATLCWLVSNGSSPLIFPIVGQRDWSSSLLCLRLWGVLRRIPFLLYTQPWSIHCPENWPPGCIRLFQAAVPLCCNRPVAGECWSVPAPPAIPPPPQWTV